MQFIRADTDAYTIVCDVGRLLGNNCFSNVKRRAVSVANPESKAFVMTSSGKAQKFMRFFNRLKRNTDGIRHPNHSRGDSARRSVHHHLASRADEHAAIL